MVQIGYHASHEQFTPSHLLALVRRAELAGFDAIKCSDHFHPWSERQGQSAFAWSWLGAAMHATSLPFGIISAPGYRYHPAVLAQTAATIGEMYEGSYGSLLAVAKRSTRQSPARTGQTRLSATHVFWNEWK